MFGNKSRKDRVSMETGYSVDRDSVWITMANGKKETMIDLTEKETETLIGWLKEDLNCLRENLKVHGLEK